MGKIIVVVVVILVMVEENDIVLGIKAMFKSNVDDVEENYNVDDLLDL